MTVLFRKLMRSIINSKGQFLAVVAVVMTGIAVYISMSTTYYNLNNARDEFYRESNFAHYYFHVVRAPSQVVAQIQSVPGIARATGRAQRDVPLLKGDGQRGTVRLVGTPIPMDREVNRVKLMSGRLFQQYPAGGGMEILVDPPFAAANQLGPNNTINVVAQGKQVPLTVTGTGISAEFIYNMKDSSTLMPDPKTFGIVMMPLNQAQELLELPGQINQVVLQLAPGADEEQVAQRVKKILEPYGVLAQYPRSQQLSHAVLQGELDSLEKTVYYLPVIFLGIAAFIQFVMLGRMIKAQRQQIGVMKALGYSSGRIIFHYTGYSLAVAAAGSLLGSLLGIGLASVISRAYAQYFNLPGAIGGLNLEALWQGLLLSLLVGAAAGLTASRSVAAINPAESMRPPAPLDGGRTFLEGWAWLWRSLNPTWKMSIRAAARNKGRFVLTLVGVLLAVALLVVSVFARDSVDYMMKAHFQQENRYDMLVRFDSPLREQELLYISGLEGVARTEPLLELPVRVYGNGTTQEDVLIGLHPGVSLKQIYGKGGQPLYLPEEGFLISERTADKLSLGVGDTVEVETLLTTGPSRRASLRVTGINRQLMGNGSYLSLSQANKILGESRLMTGAMLKITPGMEKTVENDLSELTGVASILSRQREKDNFTANLDSMVYSISIMIAFSVLLGFAIVYNSSIISFSERRREMASLRVLGFSIREVSDLLLKENLLQSLVGVALGLPLGLMMARGYMKAVSTDLMTLPVVIYPITYVFAAMGGIFFILAAHLFAVRGIKKLEMVEVLKNRD